MLSERSHKTVLAVKCALKICMAQEVASLIIGPEGTYVELSVEHSTGERDMIRIKRGSAVHAGRLRRILFQVF